jgi:hypothetical protein
MDTGDGGDAALHGDGWAEIEDTMATTELPPMPPTSDPERLLRYVLQIHPKYTEMEMTTTHLRLYATSLEQDLEQARNHSRILSSEVVTEREKKQFLERYADQIVKERNDLLHARSSKKSKYGVTTHVTWHSCCKKNGEYAADLLPSMAAFRGEKLQEVMNLMRSLEDEVRNQERLRQEVQFMLKRTQREHDSKTAADRKHIQQLEKQLIQRSMLQSTLERKLYDVESALARYDSVKSQEMSSLNKDLDEANARVAALETQCERYQARQGELEGERDDIQDRLTHVMMLKDELADQVEQLSSDLVRAQADVDTLRGEVEVLQSEDVANVKNLYEGKLAKLQDEWARREHDLKSQIDTLRQELRVNETLLQRATVHVEEQTRHSNRSLGESQDSWTRQREEWLRGPASPAADDDNVHVGSSLSRSQLSHSRYSDESDEDLLPVRRAAEVRHEHRDKRDAYRDHPDQALDHGGLVNSSHESLEHRDTSSAIYEFGLDIFPVDRMFSQVLRSVEGKEAKEETVGADELGSFRLLDEREECEKDTKSDTSDDVGSGGGLLADMHDMLKQFQDRRIEEEQKAQAAEQALATYRQDRDEFRNRLAPIA